MRFRDRIKGRRMSNNVEIRPKEDPKRVEAKQKLIDESLSNPRTLSKQPVEYNNDKNNKDRAKGALSGVMRGDLGQHMKRRSSVKDPKPSNFKKDAQFFKHNIKDN